MLTSELVGRLHKDSELSHIFKYSLIFEHKPLVVLFLLHCKDSFIYNAFSWMRSMCVYSSFFVVFVY